MLSIHSPILLICQGDQLLWNYGDLAKMKLYIRLPSLFKCFCIYFKGFISTKCSPLSEDILKWKQKYHFCKAISFFQRSAGKLFLLIFPSFWPVHTHLTHTKFHQMAFYFFKGKQFLGLDSWIFKLLYLLKVHMVLYGQRNCAERKTFLSPVPHSVSEEENSAVTFLTKSYMAVTFSLSSKLECV